MARTNKKANMWNKLRDMASTTQKLTLKEVARRTGKSVERVRYNINRLKRHGDIFAIMDSKYVTFIGQI